MEKLLFDQLVGHLNAYNVLSIFQSGFREDHIKATALTKIINDKGPQQGLTDHKTVYIRKKTCWCWTRPRHKPWLEPRTCLTDRVGHLMIHEDTTLSLSSVPKHVDQVISQLLFTTWSDSAASTVRGVGADTQSHYDSTIYRVFRLWKFLPAIAKVSRRFIE
jgi:hypothetical protein